MPKTYLEEYYQNAEAMQSLQQERLITEVTYLMHRTMRETKVTRAQLAEKLGLTKGRISQILNGYANLTLRSTADIFTALNKTLVVQQRDLFVLEPLYSCDTASPILTHWSKEEEKSWSLQRQPHNDVSPGHPTKPLALAN
jgi:transcriptional regulator with XRE-family HTH domain